MLKKLEFSMPELQDFRKTGKTEKLEKLKKLEKREIQFFRKTETPEFVPLQFSRIPSGFLSQNREAGLTIQNPGFQHYTRPFLG
jgi:hypothetical protein